MTKIKWNPATKDLRQFGWVILIGFGLIGGLLWWRGKHTAADWVWMVSALVSILALTVPALAKPFYWVWMGFGFVMGTIMSRVVLTLIFYGLFTPIALWFKLTGRDVLRRRRPSGESYWTPHPEIPASNYERLF
jgi:hypothetical protein